MSKGRPRKIIVQKMISDEDIVKRAGTWITEDLVETKDETTPFNILYNSFTNWYTENYTNGKVDQINIKKRLIEWQNTNYGFTDGINGNLRYPKFNLKPMEEEE